MAIVLLPEEVVARIAAGEAVERPASVVKELIENSIDAGATAIRADIIAGGRRLIRISDNGGGIPADEIKLAFKRHATSKLRAAQDLQALSTLGFRGEALASIAAVSQSTIITRHRGENMGVSLKLNGGAVQHHKALGAPAGTVITIENLFFNTPARLKFLKSDATEKRHIQRVVSRYAMAYPKISFALKQDGREQFRSSGRGELADVAAKVFGLKHFKRMLEVSSEETPRRAYPKISVFGYTSQPSLHRNDRSRIILFINGRAVQDNSLSHAIAQAYEGLLKSGNYPLTVLLITMPSDYVDVNVHPTKAEVRFRDANQVFVAVQRAVRRSLLDNGGSPHTDEWPLPGPAGHYRNDSRPLPAYRPFAADDRYDDADLDYIPETADAPTRPRTLPLLRVVGQIGAAYIAAEGPAGLYLVDQNAAHERVLHDQILADAQNETLPTISPLDSPTLMLSPADTALLTEMGAALAQLGFEIEVFGPNAFVFRTMPKCLASRPLAEAFPQMLARLRQSQRKPGDVITALAWAAAVRSGQVLETEEMQSIIRQLERCPSPYQSPTGQTTMIHMTREQLAKEFGRGE